MTGDEIADNLEAICAAGTYIDIDDRCWELITDMEIWIGDRGGLGVYTTEQIMLKIIRETV